VDNEHPHAQEGAAVCALVVIGIPLALLTCLAGIALRGRWPEIAALTAGVPMLGTTLAAAALVVRELLLKRCRADRSDARAAVLPLQASAARRQAERVALDAAHALSAAVDRSAAGSNGEREVLAAALALYEARLALARVTLREQGQLSEALKAELIVQHRGLGQLLQRTPRSLA
jgi:hypothetical protein